MNRLDRILFVACILCFSELALASLTGCGSPLQSAAQVSNYAAQLGEEARVYVHEDCTVPMQTLAAEPPSDERRAKGLALAAKCDVEEYAYEALRIAHAALLSGLMKAVNGSITIGELLALTDQAVTSGTKLESTIRENHK